MATALRCATLRAPPPSLSNVLSKSLKISSFCVSFSRRSTRTNCLHSLPFSDGVSHMGSVERLVTLASWGEAIGTEEVQEFAVQDTNLVQGLPYMIASTGTVCSECQNVEMHKLSLKAVLPTIGADPFRSD